MIRLLFCVPWLQGPWVLNAWSLFSATLWRNHPLLLPFPLGFPLAGVFDLERFFAVLSLVGPFAIAFRVGALPSVVCAPSTVAAAGAAATGLASRWGSLVGFAPSVRISVTRTSVNSCRWPRFLREFLRRRFLKTMIVGPRPCSSTSAATEAPAIVGCPSVMLSPPTTNTSPNWTISPGLALILSTLTTSSAATQYCFPPVLMTANMVLSSVRSGAQVDGPAFPSCVTLRSYPRLRGCGTRTIRVHFPLAEISV